MSPLERDGKRVGKDLSEEDKPNKKSKVQEKDYFGPSIEEMFNVFYGSIPKDITEGREFSLINSNNNNNNVNETLPEFVTNLISGGPKNKILSPWFFCGIVPEEAPIIGNLHSSSQELENILKETTPDLIGTVNSNEVEEIPDIEINYEQLASQIPITVLKNLRKSIQSALTAMKSGIIHCVVANQKPSIFSYFNPVTGELNFIPEDSWTEKYDGQINAPFEFYSKEEVRFKRTDLLGNLGTTEKDPKKKEKYENAMSVVAVQSLFTLEALFTGGKRHTFSERPSQWGKEYDGSFNQDELQALLNDPNCEEIIQQWKAVTNSIPSNAKFLLGVLYAPNDLDRPWDDREPNKVATGEILVLKRSEVRAGKNIERFAIAEIVNQASTKPDHVQINVGGGVKNLNKQLLAEAVTRIW